jgi:tetratricopeptide (TPR) repeat protein
MGKRKTIATAVPTVSVQFPAWFWGAVIAVAVALAYANSLSAPFIFDDVPAIEDNRTIRQLWPPWQALQPSSIGGTGVAGRPVVNLSLAVNYAISGIEPWSYHVGNTLIHGLAALTLFGLVRRTLRGPVLREQWAAQADAVAFASALLWAVHPLQTESVTCVIQRTESLVGLFYLFTLYAVGRATADTSRRASAIWGAVTFASCALGMATKEVMVTAPVVLLLYDRTFVSGSFRATLRHRWVHYGCVATWALLFYLLQGNPLRGGTANYDAITPWQYLLTQCQAIVIYLKLTLWPHPLIMDYGTGFARRLTEVLPQAVLLVALAVGTCWAAWRRPVLGFLGAWFFIILSPSSSVVPLVTQTIAEHRMYLPLAALILLGAGLLARRAPAALLPAAVALALVFGLMTVARNQLYRTPAKLWERNLILLPANPRPYAALARFADKDENFPAAVAHYENYLHAKPDDVDMRFNYARDLVKVGRRPESVPEFEKILAIRPADTVVRINYATALLALRRTDEAIRQFEIVARRAPKIGQNHFNLAEALMTGGRLPEALVSYKLATELRSNHGFFFYRYGDALLRARRLTEAADAYRSAVAFQPELHEAWANLGGVMMVLGRPHDAIPAYEAAVRLKPNDPASHQNLNYARSQVR